MNPVSKISDMSGRITQRVDDTNKFLKRAIIICGVALLKAMIWYYIDPIIAVCFFIVFLMGVSGLFGIWWMHTKELRNTIEALEEGLAISNMEEPILCEWDTEEEEEEFKDGWKRN